MGWVKTCDIHFLSLQKSVFCVECELICENNTPNCLYCGSQAVLSLSRVLGGSMRGQQTAHLIADAELDQLVRDLLRTVPPAPVRLAARSDDLHAAPVARSRHHVRTAEVTPFAAALSIREAETAAMELHPGELNLEPAISAIAERAQTLTGATGAAIALRKGDEIICRARAGRTAPDLGVRLQTDNGISADCVRTGEVMLCNDAESNPRVDLASCRRLGARSILVAPLRHFRRTWGVFEVLSASPHAFDHRDVATMQLLSSMMVAAISRLANLRPLRQTAS